MHSAVDERMSYLLSAPYNPLEHRSRLRDLFMRRPSIISITHALPVFIGVASLCALRLVFSKRNLALMANDLPRNQVLPSRKISPLRRSTMCEGRPLKGTSSYKWIRIWYRGTVRQNSSRFEFKKWAPRCAWSRFRAAVIVCKITGASSMRLSMHGAWL